MTYIGRKNNDFMSLFCIQLKRQGEDNENFKIREKSYPFSGCPEAGVARGCSALKQSGRLFFRPGGKLHNIDK